LFFLTGFFLFSTKPFKQITIIKINSKNYFSLHSILTTFNYDSSFDVMLQRGKIFHDNHLAIYSFKNNFMLIDGCFYSSYFPIIRHRGDVLLPENLAYNLLLSFSPELKFKKHGTSLKISYRKNFTNLNKIDLPKRHGSKISFIIIDPGHGGKDPGAIGIGGLREKDITLKVARYLARLLKKKKPRLKIIITRNSDRFIELGTRTAIANRYLKRYANGIFVSIHVNASISPRISGFETYFLSQNPSNEHARNTASLENNVVVLEKKRGRRYYNDIDYIQAMMLTTEIQRESSFLARYIQHGISLKQKRFKSRGVRKADFFVLRGSLMPAVLVEIGFITNKRDAKFLRQKKYQKKIVQGIFTGIDRFLKQYGRIIKGK